jgi:hypothetical protein
MVELLLPSGIITSLFFMYGVVNHPRQVLEGMMFKDGDVLYGVLTWVFCTAFVGTIIFAATVAISIGE